MDNLMELTEAPQMLPPPPGSFIDREELIQHVGEYGISQGYVVTIKQSKKDKVVILGCDRGGVYRNRRKSDSTENSRQRKTSSRLTNCPFELLGKKEDGLWVLTVKNGTHNHEPLKDFTEHPTARRFTEKEVMLIKEMTEAGLKPRQILKRLRQSNPDLLSTPKHVYNVKAKIRQGNFTVKSFKSLKSVTHAEEICQPSTSSEPLWRKHYPSRVPNFINGRFVDSQSLASIDVINPATQQIVAQVSLTTNEEFKAAVFAAKRAFPLWRNTPLISRKRIMFKLQELIRRDIDKIAFNITTEQGKTLKDAYSDVARGLEVVEYACGIGDIHTGEFISNISNGSDTYSIKEPLGVCAGICPFNFPATVPLWMYSIAITCGNTFILKPSEKAPGACLLLAELAVEAGLPNGVLNIVHGTNDIVNAICDDDNIKAVSIVGSNVDMKAIYARASSNGKCVQANTEVKNHGIIMPDANTDATLNALFASCFGAYGLNSIPISTLIFVQGSEFWEDKLVERAKELKVNAGQEPNADLGPVVSKQVKEHLCKLIQTAIDNGARLVLDGRQILVPNYELGSFIGPTILSNVSEEMECYKEETFGPLLLCMHANNLDEAIQVLNRNNKNGFMASIFTTSSTSSRKFQSEIECGQVGINVAVPAPMPFLLSSGCAGDLNSYGKFGVNFYTKIKTVTQQWKDFASNEGELVSDGFALPSNEASIALPLPSNDDGLVMPMPMPMHSDGESLHRNDSDGLSPGMETSDHLNWTLNF